MALDLKPTKLPNALLLRGCDPPSVMARLGLKRLPPDTGDSGLLTAMLLRAAAGKECRAGRHSSEGPWPLGDAEEARRMLVRTATSFSASTLQQYSRTNVSCTQRGSTRSGCTPCQLCFTRRIWDSLPCRLA
jgi:hypothetical protein